MVAGQRVGKMARRYKKSRKHGRVKPSLLSMAPIAVVAVRAIDGYKARGVEGAIAYPIASMTGYDIKGKTFNIADAASFYGVVIASYAAKKLVGMAGVNRAMKALPFRL
jgi:hypothetical protein